MRHSTTLLALLLLTGVCGQASGQGRLVYTGMDPSAPVHQVPFPEATAFARNAVEWVGRGINPAIGHAAGQFPGVVSILLTEAGFTNLTELTPTELANDDLSAFDVLYIGLTTDGILFAPAAANVQAFVDAGGGLVAEAEVDGPESWEWLPFADSIGHSGDINIRHEIVEIVAPGHPVMHGLTSAGLSNWHFSTHSTFSTPETAGFTTLVRDSESGGTAQTIAIELPECFLLAGVVPVEQQFEHPLADAEDIQYVLPKGNLVWPVLETDIPEIRIPDRPRFEGMTFRMQVWMSNPAVFPDDPFQSSNALEWTIGSGEPSSIGDGDHIWLYGEPATLGEVITVGFRVSDR